LKTKRTTDIHNRFEKATAERSMYDKDTKYYAQLTEVINCILNEYGGNNKGIRTRWFFRMDGNGYHLISLTDC
jgi:hypothetical protein